MLTVHVLREEDGDLVKEEKERLEPFPLVPGPVRLRVVIRSLRGEVSSPSRVIVKKLANYQRRSSERHSGAFVYARERTPVDDHGACWAGWVDTPARPNPKNKTQTPPGPAHRTFQLLKTTAQTKTQETDSRPSLTPHPVSRSSSGSPTSLHPPATRALT